VGSRPFETYRQMDPPVLDQTELIASYDVSMRKNRIEIASGIEGR
jgi:hypothetical protein